MRTINSSRPQKKGGKLAKLFRNNGVLDVAVEVPPCEVVPDAPSSPTSPSAQYPPQVELDSALVGLHRDLDTFMRGSVEVVEDDSGQTGPTSNPELINLTTLSSEPTSDPNVTGLPGYGNHDPQAAATIDLTTSDACEAPASDAEVTAALQQWVNRLAATACDEFPILNSTATKRQSSAEKAPKEKKTRKYTKSTVTATAAGVAKGGAACATSTPGAGSAAASVGACKKTDKFRIVPLTNDRWPARFGFDKEEEEVGGITPGQLFYPPGDNSTLLEIYHEPHITGVSIRQYTNKPYERRLNLSAKDFRSLHYKSAEILKNHARITEDARQGLPISPNYINHLDRPAGTTKVLVNLYKGQAKIHIGTPSYIDEMNQPLPPGRQPINASHCGHTITLNTIKDINERVGPLLEKSGNFYIGEIECDDE